MLNGHTFTLLTLAASQRWLLKGSPGCAEKPGHRRRFALRDSCRAFVFSSHVLSLRLTFMQIGSTASVSSSFVKPLRPETQWAPGESARHSSEISGAALLPHEWMGFMNLLCAESMFCKIKIQGLCPWCLAFICRVYVVTGLLSSAPIPWLRAFALSSLLSFSTLLYCHYMWKSAHCASCRRTLVIMLARSGVCNIHVQINSSRPQMHFGCAVFVWW